MIHHQRSLLVGLASHGIGLVVRLTVVVLLLSPARAAVWKDDKSWDDAWETAYSTWVASQWNEDFLLDRQRPTYYGIAHDCSDIPYLARLIFAYEHGLPFVIHSPGGRGELSNRSNRFDGIRGEGQRVRAFMEYVTTVVNSLTLPDDSYPIALGQIRPGDMFLVPGEHTYFVTGVGAHGVVEFVYSTTPKAAQPMLSQRSFPLYVPTDTAQMRDGYRRFRQPAALDLPYEKIRDFSPEQYQVAEASEYEYERFNQLLVQRLGAKPETPVQQADRLIDEVCEMTRQRVRYVDTGVEHLQALRKSGRRCMSESEYRQYSTFHRDLRLTTLFGQLRNLYRALRAAGDDSPTTRELTAIFEPYETSPKARAALAARCTITIDASQAIDLVDMGRLVEENKLEADPHAERLQRWGLGSKPFKSDCPRYEDR